MYEQILGSAWSALPATIRSTHVAGESRGFMQVGWGDGVVARGIAHVLGFPRPSSRVAVVLKVHPAGRGLRWVREMGSTMLASTQEVSMGLVLESFGPMVCAFRLLPEEHGFRYVQEYAALRLGGRLVRLPRWASPRVVAHVVETSDGVRTEVEIAAPLVGRLLRYEGIMAPMPPEQGS